MKLELGCGNRPTEGYLHQDIIQLKTPLDFCCEAWCVPLYEGSLDEVIAIAVMEHLRFEDLVRTLQHVHQLLKVGGVFYFDVPDLRVWNAYLYLKLNNPEIEVPYSLEDIMKTMWGHQRWIGDEHKSMWTKESIYKVCLEAGFIVDDGFEDIKKRVHRDRFNPEYVKINAHIYLKLTK